MLMFATLVFFAFRARFNPSAHKRLILLATIALMDAPTGRPPFVAITGRPHLDSVFCWLFVLLLMTYDLWSTQQLRVPIGSTTVWHAFATWVQMLARTAH